MVYLQKPALAFVVIVLALSAVSHAQDAGIPGFEDVVAEIQERMTGSVYKLSGNVELTQPDMKFYADQVEYYGDTNRLIATGNVLVIQKDHQIAADRADFNAKTKLGTFYNARGFAAMGAQPDASAFGTMQPDVQFYGETLEKTGEDIYVISHGGFTTCTQANPRWTMTSGSLKLRVDHYAFLKNTLLRAKGLPVLYLPLMYYPLSKDNRSTGFLLPTYGSSTILGQTISNGFFWAINRSQDATVQHDWYSKAGQQISGEYRYVSLLGSGNLNTRYLNQPPTTLVDPVTGTESLQNGNKTYFLNGGLSQGLGGGWYAQARADYSSNQVIRQIYSTDFNNIASRRRFLGGSVTGSVKTLRVTGTYDRNENFNSDQSSDLRSSAPRLNISRPDRLLQGLPVYYSVGGDYVHLVNQGFNDKHVRTRKDDIDRLDVAPVIRFPYTRLPFLSLNTSLTWRNTFWSDSYLVVPRSDGGINQIRQASPVSRRFFEMSANAAGPTVVRIFDSPNSRIKHTIEPFLQVTYRTAINNYDQILKVDGGDYTVGNATSYTYGTNSRLYAKKTADGPTAIPREIISAQIRQTYNTDANTFKSDQDYRTRNTNDPRSHFSPVQLSVRTSPAIGVTGSFRTEFDGRYSKFKLFGADGTWEKPFVSLTAGWSQFRYQPNDKGENVARPSHYYNSNATVRFKQNRFGIIHNFNWDIQGKSILQQRIAGYYNAQCCGFTAEYQKVDLKRLGSLAPVPEDSRFHFSVTLAGIGNVSNIFGALGGTPNR
jgi:LPS-assembly protein